MDRKVLIFCLLTFFFFGFVLLAQEPPEVIMDEEVRAENLGVSEPSILPDNPIYFLKEIVRKIRGFVSFNKEEFKLKLVNERLLEAKKLAEKGKANLSNSHLEKFKRDIEEIDERVISKFPDKYLAHFLLHQRILEKIEKTVPQDVAKKIREKREKHLEKFAQVMERVEENFPKKLKEALEKERGSEFKLFKDLERIESIENKVSKNKEEFKKIVEEKLKELKENLERMDEAKRERFKNYVEKIAGDKERQEEILGKILAEEISDDLAQKIEEAKEKLLEEKIKGKEEKKEDAEKIIKKAKEKIMEVEEKAKGFSKEEYKIKAVERLIEIAKEHLEKAMKSFEEGKYGMAFGLARSSLSEAENAERILKKLEEMKKHPEKLKEEIEKEFPGIEIPEEAKCPLVKKPICNEGIETVERDEMGCPIFKCNPLPTKHPRKGACIMVWRPVCGSDGKTYSNECFAKLAGVEILYEGVCKEESKKPLKKEIQNEEIKEQLELRL